MSDKTQQILAIIDNMRTSNAAYDAGAAKIWDLLSPDEQKALIRINSSAPLWRGEVTEGDSFYHLLSYKLATWSTYRGNEGYIVGTFIGYAAMKSQKV